MSVVSNLFRGSDRSAGSLPVTCRPARREETQAALKLVLGNHGRRASDAQVLEFLRFAVQRRIDTTALWVAEQRDRLLWAVLPVASPGRTVLLFLPSGDGYPGQAAIHLIDAVCAHQQHQGFRLAQALTETPDTAQLQLLLSARFQRMAELVYMQRLVRAGMAGFTLPPSLRTVPYSPASHPLFAATILQTYEQSLDCPGLNGLRDIEDVLAGHRATGEFDPAMWQVILKDDEPAGVILLSRLRHADSAELVYFGLTPPARGQGLGAAAMEHALAIVARAELSQITLAVDSNNLPALKRYTRHGFMRTGSKHALIRDLHRAAPAGTPPIVR